jgi:PRTRC genetic system ThiF family protein
MEKIMHNKISFVKVHQSILEPPHKVEVSLIGCGGTGTQVLQGLARMNLALESLGHPGLFVTTYDPDKVEEPNIGRQLFNSFDLGMNKAACMVTKVNRFYGYAWHHKVEKYSKYNNESIVITCTDNVKSRKDLAKVLKGPGIYNHVYWLDFGNGKKDGQVVLGEVKYTDGIRLAHIGDVGIPKKDDKETPSCSLAQALDKQDLMINPMIANTGLSMLWNMFTTLKIEYNIAFLNLQKLKLLPQLKYVTK